jgi:Aspartyl protease
MCARERTAPVGCGARATHAAEQIARGGRRRWVACVLNAALLVAVGGCAVSIGRTTSASSTVIPVKVVRGQENSVLVLLIDTTLAQQLGLPHSGSPQPVSGIGGTELVIFVSVQQWQLGSYALPKSVVGTGRLPGDRRAGAANGLLGSDILSQLGAITVDYDAGTLTISRKAAARPAEFSDGNDVPSLDRWRRAA